MYLYTCGVLLLAGLAVNVHDRRMFALTALVGASVFVPAPHDSAEHFYLFCASAEIAVGILAIASRGRAGGVILNLCVLLVIAHALGYALDGSLPFSPYRGIVKLLELMQLSACLVLSPVLVPLLRNSDATTSR